MAKNEGVDIYVIPENFIEGGRILNGMFKTRNFIEAVALALAVGIPLWFIPYPSIAVKLSVLISVVLPVFIMGIIGINDSSLLEFLQQFVKWKKNKRIMIYNTNTRSRDVRPVEVVLSQELPKDKIVKTIDTWRENKRNKSTGETFIEGRDFVFDEEEVNTSYAAAENKLLAQDDTSSDETAEKKPKKERKRKNKKGKGRGENTETAEETVSTSDTEETNDTEAETVQGADTEATETENEPHEVSDKVEENSAKEGKIPAENDVKEQDDELDEEFIDVEAVTDETDDVFDIITGE